MAQTFHETDPEEGSGGIKAFFVKYGPALFMIVLIGYIILLCIGVFAEVFKVQWILDWWIWSPPGKFR